MLKTKRGRKRRKDATESTADEEKDSLENEYQGKWEKKIQHTCRYEYWRFWKLGVLGNHLDR